MHKKFYVAAVGIFLVSPSLFGSIRKIAQKSTQGLFAVSKSKEFAGLHKLVIQDILIKNPQLQREKSQLIKRLDKVGLPLIAQDIAHQKYAKATKRFEELDVNNTTNMTLCSSWYNYLTKMYNYFAGQIL